MDLELTPCELRKRGRGPVPETRQGRLFFLSPAGRTCHAPASLRGLAAAAACLTLSLCLATLAPTGPALAQQNAKTQRAAKAPATPKPANIDRNGTIILIKSALLALDQANKTGNYTVLRDLGSLNFQANTAARLAEIFAQHRVQQIDMAGIIMLEPQLTLLPQIEPNGMLHIKGFFPSVPRQLEFELMWEPVNRHWRLFGLSVNLSDGAPQAPDMPQAPPPAALEEPPEPPTASVTSVPVPTPKPAN